MTTGTTFVIVLIHGTWARGIPPFKLAKVAPWCEPDSPLCLSLTSAISAPDRVVFDAFPWSGGNSAAARLVAAERLKEYLAVLRNKYPGSPIRIVAHSHGGNVAMYCLRDAESCAQVSGLACLSTPFLLVRPRLMGKHLADKLRFMLLALVVVICVAILVTGLRSVLAPVVEANRQVEDQRREMIRKAQDEINQKRAELEYIRGPGSSAHQAYPTNQFELKMNELIDRAQRDLDAVKEPKVEQTSWWRIIPNMLALCAIGSIVGGVLKRLGKILDWVHRWNHRAGRKLSLPRSLPFPVLIIRNTSDEASNALAGAQFMSWITSLALRWSAAVLPNIADSLGSSHWIGKLFRLCAAVAAFGLVLSAVCLALPPAAEWLGSAGLLMVGGAFATFFGSAALAILTIPLIWLLILLLGLAMAPFGLRMAVGALSLHMAAEGSPPGAWTVFQLSSTPRQFGEGQRLQHATYTNGLAIKRLRDWISGPAG